MRRNVAELLLNTDVCNDMHHLRFSYNLLLTLMMQFFSFAWLVHIDFARSFQMLSLAP